MSLRKFWIDVFLEGLVKNPHYLLSMPISVICVNLIRAFSSHNLNRKWTLQKNSPLVEHLTTISIALQSLGIWMTAAKGLVVMLLRLPILASLNFLSTAGKWWQRTREKTMHSRLDAIMKQLVYGRLGCDDDYPKWMRAIIFAPLWEELFYRFAFDKAWQGFFRASSSVTAVNSWVWANSIIFGLAHACNWFPSDQFENTVDGEVNVSEDRNEGYWGNIFGALSHSISAFITAFFVLNPLYIRHGLSASICGHAAMNLISVTLESLFVEQREEEGQ